MKRFESFGLDTSNECLWLKGAQISLAPKPFSVLRYLVENPARLVTHDELLDALWPETYVQPQVLRTYILELRKILGDDAASPRFIQTLPKRGYRFVAQVMNGDETRSVSALAGLSHDAKGGQIVARNKELAQLRAHAERAATGQRQIVFVTGEAGAGKSALAESFGQEIGSSLQANVAHGQCVEGLCKREEYYPVIEVLRQLCASPNGDLACKLLAKVAPAWLPSRWREIEMEASVLARPATPRMPGDLCAALEELALEKPLILIFEDLHWADDSTLELISALARRRAHTKLMLLATYRPPAESTAFRLKGMKQDLLMHRLCTEIELAPLTKEAVRQMLCNLLGQNPLPPGLDSFVYQHSEGNPLFITAMLEHLIAQRNLVRLGADDSARWECPASFPEMETGVPNELIHMIELEIGRLSPKEQRILEAASLSNVAFPAWAVAAVLEDDSEDIEEACDQLARQLYFMRRAGHDELPDGSRSAFYVFAHGLYREVLYQRQPAARRARGHVRIAERLGALFAGRQADVGREIAMHYEAAGNWQSATDALRAAARHATKRQAYSEAAQLLEHTLCLAENLGAAGRDAVTKQVQGELAIARNAIEGMGRRREMSRKA